MRMEVNNATLSYSRTYGGTIVFGDLNGNMNITEFYEECARLALAIGYNPKCVNEIFNLHEEEYEINE